MARQVDFCVSYQGRELHIFGVVCSADPDAGVFFPWMEDVEVFENGRKLDLTEEEEEALLGSHEVMERLDMLYDDAHDYD